MRADAPTSFTTKYGATCNDGDAGRRHRRQLLVPLPPARVAAARSPPPTWRRWPRRSRSRTRTRVAKYPEYHKVWEDGRAHDPRHLRQVRRQRARRTSDAGIAAFDEFVAAVRAAVPDGDDVPARRCPSTRHQRQADDVTFELARADGTEITITALLVDSVPSAGAAFNKRYAELATERRPRHVQRPRRPRRQRALPVDARPLVPRQVPDPLHGRLRHVRVHRRHHPEAARRCSTRTIRRATKYMDMVTNAMPAYFVSLADSTMALIRALSAPNTPTSWATIFRNVDPSQVAVVTGEEDNVFTPGYDPGASWNGFNAKGHGRLQADDVVDDGDAAAGHLRVRQSRPRRRIRRATPTCACAWARRRPSRRPTSASRTWPTRTSAAS